jgi:hypothetical protein
MFLTIALNMYFNTSSKILYSFFKIFQLLKDISKIFIEISNLMVNLSIVLNFQIKANFIVL